jgi:hypothetical protein
MARSLSDENALLRRELARVLAAGGWDTANDPSTAGNGALRPYRPARGDAADVLDLAARRQTRPTSALPRNTRTP